MDGKIHDTERYYIMVHKAWYAEANRITLPSFDLLVNTKSGISLGRMSVEWIDLGETTAARFQCFDDAWHLLPKFSDVFRKIAKVGSDITEAGFKDILDRAGFIDKTDYVRPDLGKKSRREVRSSSAIRKRR